MLRPIGTPVALALALTVGGLLNAPAEAQETIWGKFYSHEIVGFTTPGGPTALLATAGPSINDSGAVAFLGATGPISNAVFVSDLGSSAQRTIVTGNQFSFLGVGGRSPIRTNCWRSTQALRYRPAASATRSSGGMTLRGQAHIQTCSSPPAPTFPTSTSDEYAPRPP
jgi:hypothetical protein